MFRFSILIVSNPHRPKFPTTPLGDEWCPSPSWKPLKSTSPVNCNSPRILATDVLQVGPGKPPSVSVSSPGGLSADFTDITLSNMRRTIAKRLSESKSSIPHYYLTSECHIDALLGYDDYGAYRTLSFIICLTLLEFAKN